ncbi:MAG: hypothetical protein LC121_24400 [Anaerolineae bacterium]|nr:hypothetical protein [Anaerolineae bacterium]
MSGALASVGALVEMGTVDALRTPPIATENNSIGIAWIRLPDPLNVTALLIGEVTMFDVSPPDFSPWTSSIVQTSTALPSCDAAPRSAVILQSSGQARIAVNNVSLSIGGTVESPPTTPTPLRGTRRAGDVRQSGGSNFARQRSASPTHPATCRSRRQRRACRSRSTQPT